MRLRLVVVGRRIRVRVGKSAGVEMMRMRMRTTTTTTMKMSTTFFGSAVSELGSGKTGQSDDGRSFVVWGGGAGWLFCYCIIPPLFFMGGFLFFSLFRTCIRIRAGRFILVFFLLFYGLFCYIWHFQCFILHNCTFAHTQGLPGVPWYVYPGACC